MKKILHLIRKELWQVSRDPNMLRIIFIVPMIQLLILGYAINTDVKNLKMIVCDLDHSSTSRELIKRFSHNEYFKLVPTIYYKGRMEDYLLRGEAVLALIIPVNFRKDLDKGYQPQIQILLDGQNSNTSAIALGYCNVILLEFMKEFRTTSRLRNPDMYKDVRIIEPVTRIWYNPELKSVFFMIPGIISILLTIITMMLTSLGLVKEREIGTLEQLMVTPLKSWQIITGKVIPFAMIGLIEMSVAMTFGVIWFKVPILGNISTLILLASSFILTTLGMGIFISTLVTTQQQALFLSWFCMIMFILLSGFFYPIENMPMWVQYITMINPLRYFIAILRELFLKGAGLQILLPELEALLILGGSIFLLAAMRFTKRVK
jgi:ABC-2 type transport system permease protein